MLIVMRRVLILLLALVPVFVNSISIIVRSISVRIRVGTAVNIRTRINRNICMHVCIGSC